MAQGKDVPIQQIKIRRSLGAYAGLWVATSVTANPRTPPCVVLKGNDLPLDFNWQLDAAQARLLAARLVEAACRCEEARARQAADR